MKTRVDTRWPRAFKRGAIALILIASANVGFAQSFNKRFTRGDAIRLTIWQPWQIGDTGKNQTIDINGDYLIDNNGYVFFPLIGDVNVLSHNARTLANDLKEKFGAYMQDPIVVVEPLIRVALLGAFRRPGTYLVQPDASFWSLVDIAGGPDDNSDLRRMFVERNGRVAKKDLLSGFENAHTLTELGIITGDQIFLPVRKRFRFRDAFDLLKFSVSLINLYFLISRF